MCVQLHIAVSKTSALVMVDCKSVGEKSINAASNISTDGLEVLGRTVRSRGSKVNSAPVLCVFACVCACVCCFWSGYSEFSVVITELVCVQFQLQSFDIVCSTSWARRDKCCELPNLVSVCVLK